MTAVREAHRLVVGGTEDAARWRTHAEHVKVISRNKFHTQRARRTVLSSASNADIGTPGMNCSEIFELRRLLFDFQIKRIRENVPLVLETAQHAAIDVVGAEPVE